MATETVPLAERCLPDTIGQICQVCGGDLRDAVIPPRTFERIWEELDVKVRQARGINGQMALSDADWHTKDCAWAAEDLLDRAHALLEELRQLHIEEAAG